MLKLLCVKILKRVNKLNSWKRGLNFFQFTKRWPSQIPWNIFKELEYMTNLYTNVTLVNTYNLQKGFTQGGK